MLPSTGSYSMHSSDAVWIMAAVFLGMASMPAWLSSAGGRAAADSTSFGRMSDAIRSWRDLSLLFLQTES